MRLPSLCTIWPNFIGFITAMCVCSACISEDEYTTSPDVRLHFSCDTLSLDTVISGEATPTHSFQVYNRHDDAVRLPLIALRQGASSPFRVNADGTFLHGGSAAGFEISGRDSLRVFLFAKTPQSSALKPELIEDCLIFTTESGRRDSVVLRAYSQNVEELTSNVITTDTTLTGNGLPLRITDSLVVAQGATLTLEAGTQLLFHANAHLIVHGRIVARGTAENPVVMRSDRLGNMFPGQPYDRIPGGWGGITITGESYDNLLCGIDIHGGEYGIRMDSADISREKLTLENSIIHCVTGHGISARNARFTAGNCEISNAGGDCVHLIGGHATFTHCTIASFYPFTGNRGVALRYSNFEGETRFPLYAAHFTNCIITGWSEDEIMGSQSDRYTDDAFSYLFDHCLLCTPRIDNNESIVDCLWDGDVKETQREKNFTPPFDEARLIYLFRLSPQSQAAGTADANVTAAGYELDRLGRPRLEEGHASDMGCYRAESQENTEK